MPASQDHISDGTPMGANLVADGATFRVWAPGANRVYVSYDGNWDSVEPNLLVKNPQGYWSGFISGIRDGTQYKFFVVRTDPGSYKRDPYARELTPDWPRSNCIVRDPHSYPWHDHDFRPPAFNNLIVYQFHTGAFVVPNPPQSGHFLDVLTKMDYLVALGVNAVEPLPVVEFSTSFSEGYNGTDLFSPEMLYCAYDSAQLDQYLIAINRLLSRRGYGPLNRNQITGSVNQLKVFVDLCHICGLAVLLDAVYNHAGGGFDDDSIYFFDNAPRGNSNDSCYFTDQGAFGGLIFAFWKQEVRQFLIDNARFFLQEYHIDGFRYDAVQIIVNSSNDGWRFCQDLTRTVGFLMPSTLQISEYWPVDPWVVTAVDRGGAGYDATWTATLRDSIRCAIGQAVVGADATVNLDGIADALRKASGLPAMWKAVQYVESHDDVYTGHSLRIAALCDPSNHRSWYACSRARVASGLSLTAPGIPMLFMGQEFLEDKQWSDNLPIATGNLIWWDGLNQGCKPMVDYLRFMQELISLRRRHPALRGEQINVFHVHNANRVLACHRWLDGLGRDIVVVASLNETTLYGYDLGFPCPGHWLEVFNSDVYQNWVNPWTVGNSGSITADGVPLHGMPHSASLVIPANGLLVFARDAGD